MSRIIGFLTVGAVALTAIYAYNRFAGAGKSVATLGVPKA